MQKENLNVNNQLKIYDDALGQLSRPGGGEQQKKILAEVARINREIDQPLKDAVGQALAFNGKGAVAIIFKTINPLHVKLIREINKLVSFQETTSRHIFDSSVVARGKMDVLLSFVLLVVLLVAIFLSGLSREVSLRLYLKRLKSLS